MITPKQKKPFVLYASGMLNQEEGGLMHINTHKKHSKTKKEKKKLTNNETK